MRVRSIDQTIATLLADLDARGLLEETLVVRGDGVRSFAGDRQQRQRP